MSDDEEYFVVEFAPTAVHAALALVTENVAPPPVTERLTPAMHAPVVQLVQIPLVQDTQSQTIQDTVVRHVQSAETLEMVEMRSPLPTDSAPPMCVMAPVVVVPPVVVEDVQPAPVVEFVAPVPGVTYAAPAPEVELIVPAPVVTYAAPAPVIEHAARAPVDEHEERNQRLRNLNLAILVSTRMRNRARSCTLAADVTIFTRSGSSTPGKTAAGGSRAVGSNSVTSP